MVHMFMQQPTGLTRRKSIPALTDAAIDKVFEWRTPTFGDIFKHCLGQKFHHFTWDEVRGALSEEES